MNFREGLVMGILEIRTHKMRSFLSFLGVMIGVASVLLTLAFLRGSQERMRRGIELSGPGRMEIEPIRNWSVRERAGRDNLTLEDATAIARQFPGLAMVSPRADHWGRLRLGSVDEDMGVQGLTPESAKRDWVYTLRGRMISGRDVESFARVCLLIQRGEPSAKSYWRKYYAEYFREPLDKVFERQDPLGASVLIGETAFTVIGVLKEPDEDKDPRWFRWGRDERVIVPLTTLQKYLSDSEDLDDIQVDTGDPTTVPYYNSAIMKLLKRRHRNADRAFVIRNRADMMRESMAQMARMRLVFMGIGVISLLAGGIGIMNVALAVVYSRIREVGIRRAVGARRVDILVQFVLESIVLSFCGGVGGVALGALGVWQVPRFWTEFEAAISPSSVLICLAISIGVGLFFSIYPAWQAARMDPVEALRYE